MKIGVVILGDIHLSIENNPVIEKIDSLTKAIKDQMNYTEQLFICVVGDIANTGHEEEYIAGELVLDELIRNLKEFLTVDIRILMVPGNHDCDFSDDQSAREVLMDTITTNSEVVSQGIVNNILSVQDNYRKFEQTITHSEKANCKYDNQLFKQYTYNIKNKSITFNLFNTSWISTRKEKPGSMIFPMGNIEKNKLYNESDIRVSILHHHLRWLNPDNARELSALLEEHSDIIISGHEHTPENYRKVKQDDFLYIIETGALQTCDEDESVFQTFIFDLKNDKYKHNEFEWDNKTKIYITDHNNDWLNINEIFSVKNKLQIRLNDVFMKDLDDPGAPFQHPKKHSLSLQDIFVYPEVDEITIDQRDILNNYYDSYALLNEETKSNLILIGNESVGKTALIRKFYMDYFNKGYYPILLDAHDLKKASENNIRKKINDAINTQYIGRHIIDQYRQLPQNKKIIFIDDFQNLSLNMKGKQQLLELIEKEASRLIITLSGMQDIRDLFLQYSEHKESEFRMFEITEFGHKKRAELIRQWNNLGSEDSIVRNDQTERQLHALVKNGQVPSYPFFLLTILQASESMTPHQMKDSTQGHYYDVLIGDALTKMRPDNRNIDILKNYISHLAYFIYTNQDKSFTEIEFKKIHDEFNQKYELNLDFNNYKNDLIHSSLIYLNYDVYKFKYPYVYFYFVAKYYSDNLERTRTKDKLKSEIATMSNNLYNDEYANVLMFLIHLSKNEYILNQVMTATKRTFSDLKEITLEDDVTSLNELIKELPKMIIEDNLNVEKNREQMHEQYDNFERQSKTIDNQEIKNNDHKHIDKINEINQGFKSIELIGQLLHNYPGYIEGADKRELGDEAINSGLRILRVFLTQILEDKDYLLGMIERLLKEHRVREIDDRKIEEYARKIVFNLSSWIVFSVLKGISKSVGNKDMVEIISNVIKENPYTSRRLLGISISLDHAYSIPHTDIKKLYKDINGNVLTTEILRRMVAQHLHLFEVPYNERQEICAAVEINYNQQLKQRTRRALNV